MIEAVPSIELVNLSCGGCFASVEETNHGGAFDSFTLNYNGTDSALITNGTNYTAAGIQAALTIAEAGYPVYLVERQPSIGGRMAQLDKTFPTLDCST
mgnify:CR=1 FL=1